MKCMHEFKDVNYNADLFCKTCGMDIGFEPIKINHKGSVQFYCCQNCTKPR